MFLALTRPYRELPYRETELTSSATRILEDHKGIEPFYCIVPFAGLLAVVTETWPIDGEFVIRPTYTPQTSQFEVANLY